MILDLLQSLILETIILILSSYFGKSEIENPQSQIKYREHKNIDKSQSEPSQSLGRF